jgi:hypothetical protein
MLLVSLIRPADYAERIRQGWRDQVLVGPPL